MQVVRQLTYTLARGPSYARSVRFARWEWVLLTALGGCYEGVEDPPAGEDSSALATDGLSDASSGGRGEDPADDESGGPTEDPPTTESECEGVLRLGPTRLSRLTAAEYVNAVDDLLGIEVDPSELPGDERVGPFAANIYSAVATTQLADYLNVAEAVATQAAPRMLEDGCRGESEDLLGCAHSLLLGRAPLAYRRPLSAGQRDRLDASFDTGAAESPELALGQGLVAILMSPSFLYRLEPTPPTEANAPAEIDAYATAQRLSFLLWSSVPDQLLMDVAESGELNDPQVRRAQAERMLDDPRAARSIGRRYGEWVGVTDLEVAPKDVELFPEFDAALAADMTTAFEAFASEMVLSGGTQLDLLSSREAFVSEALADFYGVDVSGAPQRDGLYAVELPEGERAGLLTRASVMAELAHQDQTAPVHRGAFIRAALMCQPPPPPPPDVADDPVPIDPNASARERFAMHAAEPSCAGCHMLLEPLGFGLEHYDAIGRYRTMDGNLAVDARGELLVSDVDGPFEGGIELSERLARSAQVQHCIALQHVRLAALREFEEDDESAECLARDLLADRTPESISLRELLVATVVDESFTQRLVAAAE